jgi:hypothetical protein
MSKLISSICIFFSICQFSIGIWEATVAASNAPSGNPELSPPDQEIYAFAITKACCNILSAIVLSFTGAILCCVEPNTNSDKSDNSKNGLFQVICFGTSIWGLVRFFQKTWRTSLINPYQNVLLVEMIFFFSVIGLTLIAICTACCTLCFIREDNESKNKINQITKLDKLIGTGGTDCPNTDYIKTDYIKTDCPNTDYIKTNLNTNLNTNPNTNLNTNV